MLAVIMCTPAARAQYATPAAQTKGSLENPVQPLFDFNDSDIKFNLRSMMNLLRDHNHEGWVLAAYPDPKTGRPLIGAGFSLDVAATEHVQSDPLNADGFVEPSSEQLWQAAGLEPERLQQILGRFHRDQNARPKKRYRRKPRKPKLAPELTDEEATRLLRVSAIQAVHNARAYCRDFDHLTASQQLGLSQLVFQMGVNLEEFVQFLSALNGDNRYSRMSPFDDRTETENEHWETVRSTLVDSLWARSFSSRATTVIAMFDPEYARDATAAEQRVEAILRPSEEAPKKQAPDIFRTRSRNHKRGSVHPRKVTRKPTRKLK